MSDSQSVKVERVTSLPDGFALLRSEAAQEGFRNMEALFGQWQDGTQRFDRPGELLVVARLSGELAGIGGITEDFIDPSALRMRRFFVRAPYRRRGVGWSIADFLLTAASPLSRPIFVHAETEEATAFWESLSFERIEREKTTHRLAIRL